MKTFEGNIVDVLSEKIFPGKITIKNQRIFSIVQNNKKYDNYLLPGFIDSHIHVESSLLTPGEFGRLVTSFGTVATVSDCHEIANVLGKNGVEYMLKEGAKTPLKIYFSIPSCVPATKFETNGSAIGLKEMEELMQNDALLYLGEFMDFMGVINDESFARQKLDLAKKYNKLIDGHAPGLMGKNAKKYSEAGITTDHECVSAKEAIQKIGFGMKVQIREGAAVKNFDDLIGIAHKHSQNCMLCSDDLHPNVLIRGHINLLVKRALKRGIDLMKVLKMACVNPVKHYNLKVGLLQKGDLADFIEVDNLREFNIIKTVINGKIIYQSDKKIITYQKPEIINNFSVEYQNNLSVFGENKKNNVIELIKDQVLTKKSALSAKVVKNEIVSDVKNDILKIVCLCRYKKTSKPTIAFVRGFELKKGAIASSVAHDSHNIIAVGTNDTDILRAINLIVKNKGGISAVDGQNEFILPLPVAGIMSDRPFESVIKDYQKLENIAKEFGTNLPSAYMSLSFLTLLVIPSIKISDQGLFDSNNFKFI